MIKKYKGSCLCGTIEFVFNGSLDDIWFCHCDNCRKNYGMYGAFAGVLKNNIVFKNFAKIQHYRSKTKAIRSFCSICGSPISWAQNSKSVIYIFLGSLNGKVCIKNAKHIWTSERGGYYDICDNFPQYKTHP